MDDFFNFRLSREDVAGLDDDEYLWALMEPAWDDPEDTTTGQQLLAKVTYFCRTVQNGGPVTAFHNFGPEGVEEVRKGLETLGASDLLNALDEAERIVFPKGLPTTMEETRSHIDGLDRDTISESLEPPTVALENERTLQRYLRRYVDAHPDEFFRD